MCKERRDGRYCSSFAYFLPNIRINFRLCDLLPSSLPDHNSHLPLITLQPQ